MIVQWCIKGMWLPNDTEARQIIDNGNGLVSNWWRHRGTISPSEVREVLTEANLDRHINHYDKVDPATGLSFAASTPFISMAAGTIERDSIARTNVAHRARRTALWFGTNFGRNDYAYLYTCWVILAPRAAVSIECVAEEVRDLNVYRRYSAYQTEGEITAKVIVPVNQIQGVERWSASPRGVFERDWEHRNAGFTRPERLSNVRELI